MNASRGQDDASLDQVNLINYRDDVIGDQDGVTRDQVNLIGDQVDVIADQVALAGLLVHSGKCLVPYAGYRYGSRKTSLRLEAKGSNIDPND